MLCRGVVVIAPQLIDKVASISSLLLDHNNWLLQRWWEPEHYSVAVQDLN